MTKTIAIMQPTFVPWLGYFALMDQVDEFVFLDDVQFDKRSWQQRNRIKTANGPTWVTVPVKTKGLGEQTINRVEIDYESKVFPRKLVRAIENNYSKAPHFDTYGGKILELIEGPYSSIGELNISLIEHIKETLGIETVTSRSSNMLVEGRKAERLVNICKMQGANTYFSPPGSRAYIDESGAFDTAGIPVRYIAYEHPIYPQVFGDFFPQLSVVDLLFNMGKDSLSVIREGASLGS